MKQQNKKDQKWIKETITHILVICAIVSFVFMVIKTNITINNSKQSTEAFAKCMSESSKSTKEGK